MGQAGGATLNGTFGRSLEGVTSLGPWVGVAGSRGGQPPPVGFIWGGVQPAAGVDFFWDIGVGGCKIRV